MNPLEILPLEVFLQVLDSVDDIRDKASARSVSKDWKAVVSSTSAWEPIFDAYSKYSRLPHPIMNTLHIFKQLDLIYGLWGRELAPYFVPMWISRYERLHCDERLHNTKPFRFGGIYCLYTQCEVALTVLHFLQVIYALTAIFSKRQLWNDWPGLQIATTAVCLVASMLLAINKSPTTFAYFLGILIWMLALAAEIDVFDGAILLTSISTSCFILAFLLANFPSANNVRWAGSAVRYVVIASAGAYSGLLFVVPYLLVATAALLLVAPWQYTHHYRTKTSVLATLLRSPGEFSLAFAAVVAVNAGLAMSKMSISRNQVAVHTISPWFLITSLSMTILLMSLTQVFVFVIYVLSRADAMQAFFSKAISAHRLAAKSRLAISSLAVFLYWMMVVIIVYRIFALSTGATVFL